MKFAGIGIAIMLSALLSGCDNTSKNTEAGKANQSALANDENLLSIPALPMIQNSIKTLVPKLNGQFDLSAVQKICLLAREEMTKDDIAILLNREGIDASQIAPQGAPLSLLVNNDQPARQTLCAAWVASSMLEPFNASEITEQQTRQVKEKNKTRKVTVDVIVNNKLQASLATKTAIARTNAEFYALIASRLEAMPGHSLENYTALIKSQFAALAPAYLKRIQELYSPSFAGYQLLSLNKGNVIFSNEDGYRFVYDSEGALLTYGGINWLGKGDILDKQYMLRVNYFNPQVIAALNHAQ